MTIPILFVLLLCISAWADAFLTGKSDFRGSSPCYSNNFLLELKATADDSSTPSKDSDSRPESNVDKAVDAGGSSALYEELKRRQVQLEKGIGKRYKTRTQKGFLNIHSDPHSGPYDVDNIIGQLQEGQIVRSVGPPIDDWIHHDAGGWSISKFEGFTFLEPLN